MGVSYLVAVSGGVDSVVLLDMLVKKGETRLAVAHFDHGIRPDSAADARFAEGMAKKYNLLFVMKREELGANASEEIARKRRYAFLNEQANRLEATVMTAHHGDDIVETVAINLIRGTGWQGLAVLGNTAIERPLLTMTKEQIYDYALANRLEWVEDSTNGQLVYLRNRLRRKIATLRDEDRRLVMALRDNQTQLRTAIDEEIQRFMNADGIYARYFFNSIETPLAVELLRVAVEKVGSKAPTRPQARQGILAIKTARAGTVFQLGGGVRLHFLTRDFTILPPQKVLS